MNKIALYGGGAATVLLATYIYGRRSVGAQPFGATGFSSLDYALAMPKLALYAGKQVSLAATGAWLADYRKAENSASFWQAPAYNVQAYYAAGYWMAVAARLLHSRSLAAHAQGLVTKGGVLYAIPFSSQLTGSVGAIMSTARETISQAAGEKGAKQVASILAVLGEHARPEAIAASQEIATTKGWVAEGAKASARDVRDVASSAGGALSTGLSVVRALVGLTQPDGKPYSWWLRWGTRVGVGIALAIVARWYFRPRIAAVRAALAAPTAPKQIAVVGP